MLLLLSFLLFLLLSFLGNDHIILNSFLERVIKETTVVNKGYGHEATQFWHLFEVHLGLSDHLRHIAVLESLNDVFLGLDDWGAAAFGSFFSCFFCFFFGLTVFEDFVRDWRLFLVKNAVDHELMTLRGMHELNHLRSLFVEMRFVVRLLIDFFLRVDQLAHIHTSRTRLLLHKFHKLLEIILKIRAFANICHEILFGSAHGGSR